MPDDLIVLARFAYRHEAELARGYLDDASIDSVLLADDAGGAEAGLTFSNTARLMVREEDASRAREVLVAAGSLGEDPS